MKTDSNFPLQIDIIDAEEALHMEDLQVQLEKSDLYVEFNKAIKKLRHLLHHNHVQFDGSAEQSFGKEVIYRVMEESLAYLGDLRQGTFFAANHHSRALLEQYAIMEYVFSDDGRKNNFLHRFHTFPRLAFHKVFHQHEDAFLKFSKDVCDDYFADYNDLDEEIFNIFGTSNYEKLLKLRTWRGNTQIANLFEKCPKPDQIKSNYAKLCLFTHVSSICRRSELELFPKFSKSTEVMLLITVMYAVFSYVCIKQEELFDYVVQDKLDDIFLELAEIISKSHKDLIP